MKNVFISYRHVEPDQSLAHSIATSLTKRHLKVFVDTKMLVGTKWVKEIEKQIRMAHYFIALLSKDSIRSDMVCREVDLAYKMTKKAKNRLSILPIRVAFEGELFNRSAMQSSATSSRCSTPWPASWPGSSRRP